MSTNLPVLNVEDPHQLILFKDRDHLLQDGTKVPPDRSFLCVGMGRKAQRWEAGLPVEQIFEQPDKELPDITRLNDEIPKDRWQIGNDGEPRAPWSIAWGVYLVDLLNAQD
jgi:hypothetical protein